MMDWFPEHKELRKSILLVMLGVFIGSLSSVFNASSISFDLAITGFSFLLIALGLLVVCLLAYAVFSHDHNKRNEVYDISGIASAAFMIILLFGGLGSISNSEQKIRNEKARLSVGELKVIADDSAMFSIDVENALL